MEESPMLSASIWHRYQIFGWIFFLAGPAEELSFQLDPVLFIF